MIKNIQEIIMTNKTSRSQLRATWNYEARNREKTRINSYKRTARLFVKTYASEDDMEELIKIYEENKDKRQKLIYLFFVERQIRGKTIQKYAFF